MMAMYHVEGLVSYEEECDCPYCPGHRHNGSVDRDVEAESVKEAMEVALKEWNDGNDQSAKWVLPAAVKVQLITEEIHMRRLGMPELPLFEQVTA
jgi:hypothetical protein